MVNQILNKQTSRMVNIGTQAFKKALREDNIDLNKLKELGYNNNGKPFNSSPPKIVKQVKFISKSTTIDEDEEEDIDGDEILKLTEGMSDEELKAMTVGDLLNKLGLLEV